MVNCKYEYKGHIFENEVQLDDFLINNRKFESEFGDMVFSLATKLDTLHKAREMQDATKDLKKKSKPIYIDGEDVSTEPPPYIGVTAFLASYITQDEKQLTPEFRKDEFFKRKELIWGDETQDINVDYDSRTGKGVYTKEERALIFGNDPVRRLSKEEMKLWEDIIYEGWQQQGTMGSDVHFIIQMYFTKYKGQYNFKTLSKPEIYNLIKNKVKVDETIALKILDYAEFLKSELYKTFDSKEEDNDLDFIPELKIQGDLNRSNPDGVKTLVGSIDLLVVDKFGNSHIIDFKTSPKEYMDYNSAKVRTFMYQLEVYAKLLEKFGFHMSDSRRIIAPIKFENLHLTNKDEALKDYTKAVFTYDDISWDTTELLKDITQQIRNDNNLNKNINEFLNVPILKEVSANKIIERVRETMGKMFARNNRTFGDIDIEDLLKTATQDNKGIWHWTPKEYDKQFSGKDKAELHQKVKTWLDTIESADYRRAQTIIDALEYGQKNETTDINDILRHIKTRKVADETSDASSFLKYLGQYCNSNWEVLKDMTAANYFGAIFVQNKYTKQVDIIKISSKNLKKQLYKERIVNGKEVQDKRRSSILYAHEIDAIEKKQPKSNILPGIAGNLELIESVLIANEYAPKFDGLAKIGHIQAINPYIGQSISATNEEIQYSYKKLRKYVPEVDGFDNITDGKLQFHNLLELAENDLETELNKEGVGQLSGRSDIKTLKTVLDNAVDNSEKLKAVLNIMNELLKRNSSLRQLQNNFASREARLYNRCVLAAAELRGITFRQQTAKTEKWPSLNIKKALTKGLYSSYIDNPGNLDSQTLNTLTQLVTEGYQQVRKDMQDYIAETRNKIEALKKEKNYGWLVEHTIGNETDLFKNMFREEFTNDLILKDPDDPTNGLNTAEKDFLRYFLKIVNKNRFNKSDAELEDMKSSGDLAYFRAPLARGSISSEVAMQGLWDALKSRLEKWTPANAARELRAAAEGIFTEDSYNTLPSQTNDDLFEMNNRFYRGDTDEQYREEAITQNGVEFFERNLETLLLEQTFAYKTKQRLDEVFPMIRAAMTHLKVMGENEQFMSFDEDLQYAQDYVRAVMKGQPIDKNLKDLENKAILNKIKQAASFTALAFSPVQGLYQSIQGLWVDISLLIRKPDGTKAFSFNNFMKAFKIVYADAFHWSEEPTKLQLLNELYAMNDMDMNTYLKGIASDRHGIYNAYDLAFKFSSRPDYYNRMVILVAQMLEDGTWDAYEVENKKLVYKFDKDKRFEHFRTGQTGHPQYGHERALYYAVAQQHIEEGATNQDGTKFQLNPDAIAPLPLAHTVQEIESFKALGDLIYGYYAHERKSLIHATFYGSMFMQMKTYWSGKKNQYLAPGGYKVQGHWVHAKTQDGKPLYYQVVDGKIRTDLPPTDAENTGAPVLRWEGQWQEGIAITLSTIANSTIENIKSGDPIFAALANAVKEKYGDSEDMERVLKANLGQLAYDITLYFIIGGIAAGYMADWAKDLTKESKENESIAEGLRASMANILAMSVRNSAADFAFWESIGNPALQWTPFSFDTGKRIFSNVVNVAFGDRTVWGGFTNTFAATKQFKPALQLIAPLNVPKE